MKPCIWLLLTVQVTEQRLELFQHVCFPALVKPQDEHVELILLAHVLDKAIHQRKHGTCAGLCCPGLLLQLCCAGLLLLLQHSSSYYPIMAI